jgi:hypothetical protein
LVGAVIAPPELPIRLEPLPVDRMLTTKQVATILAVSIDVLRKWRQRRKGLRYLRYFDGAIRYRLSDAMKFLEASTVSH